MSRGLYSDPFLKELIEKKPKLAKAFFEVIANSEYVGEHEVISCLETPDWVLLKAGVGACKNSNFPIKEFEKFLANDEVLTNNFWSIFSYPNIDKSHIDKLMRHSDLNVQGLALAHEFGDRKGLLKYLIKVTSDNSFNSYVVIKICETVVLHDELFDYLVTVHEFEGGSRSIGQALWENPSLNELHKAQLALLGIQPKEGDDSFWSDFLDRYISSIPFYQSLSASFGSYKLQKFETIPKFDDEIEATFIEYGHHFSALLPGDSGALIRVNEKALSDLNSLDFLQRLFWTDLCQRDDFEIYRRNAYRTDDLFISHPILGREFEEAYSNNATHLGGVLIFDNQKWLIGGEELSADRAAVELTSSEDNMAAIVENGNYEHLGQTLIALTFEVPDLSEKYGFELTEDAEEWMIEAALEFAEPDSFDVSADLNPLFREMLSYRKISDAKKSTLLNFLLLGYASEPSKLRNDCIHFLGCMALHDATPEIILNRLKELDHPMINEVLKSKINCANCGIEIGYGLCLKCNSKNLKSARTYTEDKADEVYLRGLDLARNEKPFEAMEVWLPLAQSADLTSIAAIAATLWRLERFEEAKTWIVWLAELDMEDVEALAGRLDVPFSEFERFAAEGKI